MGLRIRERSRPFREKLNTVLRSARAKQNFLEVLAIFKNEAHILDEWVSHYLSQGAERIHLIDNGSDDNFLEILQPYIEHGRVRLWKDPRRYIQFKAYNELLPLLRKETAWLIVCDLDEFIYARPPFLSIPHYLRSLPWKVSCVQVLWKNYGSSGHKSQPLSVRSNFLHRVNYALGKTSRGMEGGTICCKYIARLARVRTLCLHRAELFWGENLLANGQPVIPKDFQTISEEVLKSSSLHLNHYFLQSEEYFYNVKTRRGDAVSPTGDNLRTKEFFSEFDFNDIRDDELAQMIKGATTSQSER